MDALEQVVAENEIPRRLDIGAHNNGVQRIQIWRGLRVAAWKGQLHETEA